MNFSIVEPFHAYPIFVDARLDLEHSTLNIFIETIVIVFGGGVPLKKGGTQPAII